MKERQNRYSIRKLTVGAASVLIGFAFMSGSQSAKADTVTPDQNGNQDQGSPINTQEVPRVTAPVTLGQNQSTATARDTNTQAAVKLNKIPSNNSVDQNKNQTNVNNPVTSQSESRAVLNRVAPSSFINFAASTTTTPTNAPSDATNQTQAPTTSVKEVTTWADLVAAVNDKDVNGVDISGTIKNTANQDLIINKDFTIHGLDGAVLDLGSKSIQNNAKLTLNDIAISGSIIGSDSVDIKGNVTSTVDAAHAATLTDSQLAQQIGAPRYGAVVSNWKAANITASAVNVEQGASLSINRTIVGDGINLGQTGSVNVGVNAKLNVTLKNGTEAYTNLRSSEQNGTLDNASAAIRALSSGAFTTDDGSVINLNVGHGRGVVFNEPFGGNTAIQVTDTTAFYRPRYNSDLQSVGGPSTFALGNIIIFI